MITAALLFGGASLRLVPVANAQTVLDIKSFGARCNGSDDTGAVQAAMNAIPVGGTLNFSCMAGITQVSLSGRSNVTIAGTNGGGVTLLTQTGDAWSRAFAITYCSSCVIRDMVFEGNNKDMIPFNIEESSNSTVSGLTVRNVNHAGCAFLAVHNTGNKYLNNTIQNAGMDRSPGQYDTARGMWLGGVSDTTKESSATVSGNKFIDISGTALAVHGSGSTITDNTGVRLNWACIKVLPLGGAGSTLIANNNCSGAGATWLIGGGIMTEYYNAAYETTVIRNNVLQGYSSSDVTRVPDSPSVGINIANTPDKVTHNVQILNNTIRDMLYDSIQISGPTDNFLIDGNIMERTISNGTQWNGINIQGDQGKLITNGTIRRNVIRGKFDGIHMFGSSSGTINGLNIDGNSVTAQSRDGLHIEVDTGSVMNVSSTNNCYSSIGNKTVWDNRSNPLPVAPLSSGCSDPTSSVSVTAPATGQNVSGTATLQASTSSSVVGVQFKIDGAAYGMELLSQPYSLNWDSRTSSNGSHQITAESRDASGNKVTSPAVSVNVSNQTPDTAAPSVSISSPGAGQTVSSSITISASATDNVGVTGVQFLVDGVAYGSELTSGPYSISWNSSSVANGTHTFSATARDAAGNRATSAAVSVNVSNKAADTTAPTVAISSPTAGQTVSGSVTLSASASDNVGVVGVQFLVDGAAYGSELTAAPYSISWSSTSVANGAHTISATARDAAGNRKTSSTVSVTVSNTTLLPSLPTIRVNAGGPTYTDPSGKVWAADYGYSGGKVDSVTTAIANTTTPQLYQTSRWSNNTLSYQFSVPNGAYTVNLKFAETYFKNAGQRVFNVTINGAAALTNFDIVAAAGGPNRAVDKSTNVTVTNGVISIQSKATVDDPQVNAIEIVPQTSTPAPPTQPTLPTIRVNAGGAAYTDPAGNVWTADSGFSGGQVDVVTTAIANTTAQALYQTSRWNVGPLTYQFGVPNGAYTVNLKFAETYFKSTGQRVFNVAINGQTVLTNFDIVAAAGGPNRAVDKSSTVNVTNGVIAIVATGIVDDAQVNAIEILPQTSSSTPAPPAQPAKTVVRVNAGGAAYTDPTGNTWAADTGFSGGSIDSVTTAISNTTTPALYQTSRWNGGSLVYQFAVTNATYTVNLKFAETYFTNAGQRVFNVAINGQTVLTNFDIVAQAGGSNRAVDKAFTVNATNGTIAIQLSGVVDDPQINAFEIY